MKRILVGGFILLQYVVALPQNIGVGTNAPTGKLQLNHRSSMSPGLLLVDSTPSRAGSIRFNNIGSSKYVEAWGYSGNNFSSAEQYLDVQSDSIFIATFRGNGNVGIGNLSPLHKLDVGGAVNTNNEYRLSGKSILRIGSPDGSFYRNLYVGDSAGFSNSSGYGNTFIGGRAGRSTTTGYANTFIGVYTGRLNMSGHNNVFIGSQAGEFSNGFQNTFIGGSAGTNNTSGNNNSFFGNSAGNANANGIQNTFIGSGSGRSNEGGNNNVFVGMSAGGSNVSGFNNTLFGAFSDIGSDGLVNATAIGYLAYVTQSNSLVLGSINGVNSATADTKVGIGTTSPDEKLEVNGNIKLNGEINRSQTGTAHLLPIAYGSVSETGIINSGTGNFTVVRNSTGYYSITISGHSYTSASYTTLLTPIFTGPAVFASSNANLGKLNVNIFNASGGFEDAAFHFLVYKQ